MTADGVKSVRLMQPGRFSIFVHASLAFAIRLLIVFAVEIIEGRGGSNNASVFSGFKYTDIDYAVYTDGARHVRSGNSPFDRETYRYTPFLAHLLSPLLDHGDGGLGARGKILFCFADVLVGCCIYLILRLTSSSSAGSHLRTTGLWWLYNPLPINICTRGSAESLMPLLPVLATVLVTQVRLPNG